MPDDPSATLAGIRERGYRNGATGAECARLSDAAAVDVPLLVAALKAALALHQGVTDGDYPESRALCDEDGDDAPCATVLAITAELGKGLAMATLDEDAKIVLRDAGVSQAAWARANFMADGKWCGDACGCPDNRCKDGFHHYPDDECGCLRVLLEQYLAREGTFAEFPKTPANPSAPPAGTGEDEGP